MTTLLVFEFPSTGPFGAEAVEAYRDLAIDIAGEEGLVWKVWIEDPARQVAGGVYLFTTEELADAYTAKHTTRLESFGVTGVTATRYQVNQELSELDHAVLRRP
ncbi:monooxygenase [Corynebacterium guangdongense]|uniref:Monooxygenase n=1 Tax=Corynebacterium guangdongense TaxID=1783348 RepID=A0ABU2A0Q3_9CORY|nr:monooxygenase [Corynebacterium guangdongense]MDR7330670.1 hypothetical protein [Corynebacterium guangdongense]WJZ16686.1 Putative monooxygenase YdhR [Corynebacterium guangdongense]